MHTQKNSGNKSSRKMEIITIEESPPSYSKKGIKGNNQRSSKAVEIITLNQSQEDPQKGIKGNNQCSSKAVEIITLNQSQEDPPKEVQVKNGDLSSSWDIDVEGEVSEIVPETKQSNASFERTCYKSSFTGYLTEKEFSMETGEHLKNDATPIKTCFNCLGNHSMSNCTKTKDFNAISRNRRSILGKKMSSVRYHEDMENKYNDFKPGQISEDLKEALGIRDFEIPEYIYRMRYLGYPPGWLKDAEVKRSDILLFDGTGKRLSHPEEEEGETDVCLIKYNPEKLIDYPGFNVPLPKRFKDQHWKLNYPPIRECHSKKLFLRYMSKNKAIKYKRKRLRDEVPRNSNDVNVARGDMEIEDLQDIDSSIEFNPPLPPEVPNPPEPLEKEEGELSEDSNEGKESQASSTSPRNTPSAKRKIPPQDDIISTPEGQTLTTPQGSVSAPKRLHRSASKGFTLGVTIPESITPYSLLPDSSKWSVDVSDHILFENLPDALGTWDKMRGIVSTVRNLINELHADDEDD